MHIYIHIPFCESKCPYCAFGSYTDKFDLVQKYFNALKFEISNFLQNNPNLKISTLFFGGGTPSSVGAEFYAKIFEILKPKFTKFAEITSEANPNSANLKWLKQMRELGLNRISFGAQSFSEKKLKFLGRIHNSNQIHKAVQNANLAGFKNINLDLIYGSKFDDKKNIEFEISNLEKLQISHISAYSLSLEEKTPFFGKENFKKDSVRLANFLFEKLANLGFFQYEISNFAKKNKICKHNLAYWQGKNYAGFGAFSVGTNGSKRLYSAQNLNEYIKNPLEKIVENLSKFDKKNEAIFLGARSIVGINSQILNQNELEKAKILTKNKKLKFDGKIFYNQNYLLADEIALFITS